MKLVFHRFKEFSVLCRREVCKLGEETVHCVLQAWDERNPGTKPALDFLNLQILVHHPGSHFFYFNQSFNPVIFKKKNIDTSFVLDQTKCLMVPL